MGKKYQMGEGGDTARRYSLTNTSPKKSSTQTLVLLLSRFMPVRTFPKQVIHVRYLVSNKFQSDYTGNLRSRPVSVFYKQIRLDRLLFSVEDCLSAYVSRISFWNRFGERRFTILWVILWQPHQIFSDHVARAGYVLSPLFSPSCCWYDWCTQDRGCFQRLELVRFLGYDPGRRSLPTADCLVAFLWSSDDIALPTTCKAKGEL